VRRDLSKNDKSWFYCIVYSFVYYRIYFRFPTYSLLFAFCFKSVYSINLVLFVHCVRKFMQRSQYYIHKLLILQKSRQNPFIKSLVLRWIYQFYNRLYFFLSFNVLEEPQRVSKIFLNSEVATRNQRCGETFSINIFSRIEVTHIRQKRAIIGNQNCRLL